MSILFGPYYKDFVIGIYENDYGFENCLAEPLDDLDEFNNETVFSLFKQDDIQVIKAYGVKTNDGWRVFRNESEADEFIKKTLKEFDYGRCC